ncbi:MAG: rhodanese-like domain-containing protein [Rhodoblastus sp.]
MRTRYTGKQETDEGRLMSGDGAHKFFVTTKWLADHLRAPDIFVVDASWHLPTANRNARAEYLAGHIPGAVHFDIDEITDK